jgi:hypothetical protein
MNFTEKIAICYTCCGPTYRKTALNKLKNFHINHPNLYYFIITDDEKYFNGLERENLVINNIKDFHQDYPHLKKYEPFLESLDENDYATKFINSGYKFPFSTMRFHLLQAKKYNICNVAMLGTDTDLNLNFINDELLQNKNIIYNAVTAWYKNILEENMMHVVNILKDKYNLEVEQEPMVFDAAGRLYVFDNVEKMIHFFNVWDNVMLTLYNENKIKDFGGWYAINDEYILAPIYNALGIKSPLSRDLFVNLFNVNHKPEEERFWLYNK